MEKEINSNAVSELDEASLEQVTGGGKAIPNPIFAIGGGAMAEPDKVRGRDFDPGTPMLGTANEINKKPDIADITFY